MGILPISRVDVGVLLRLYSDETFGGQNPITTPQLSEGLPTGPDETVLGSSLGTDRRLSVGTGSPPVPELTGGPGTVASKRRRRDATPVGRPIPRPPVGRYPDPRLLVPPESYRMTTLWVESARVDRGRAPGRRAGPRLKPRHV